MSFIGIESDGILINVIAVAYAHLDKCNSSAFKCWQPMLGLVRTFVIKSLRKRKKANYEFFVCAQSRLSARLVK